MFPLLPALGSPNVGCVAYTSAHNALSMQANACRSTIRLPPPPPPARSDATCHKISSAVYSAIMTRQQSSCQRLFVRACRLTLAPVSAPGQVPCTLRVQFEHRVATLQDELSAQDEEQTRASRERSRQELIREMLRLFRLDKDTTSTRTGAVERLEQHVFEAVGSGSLYSSVDGRDVDVIRHCVCGGMDDILRHLLSLHVSITV